MGLWQRSKQSFDAWEDRTAKVLEVTLKSPLLLGPSASLLTKVMRGKAAADRAVAGVWSTLGLPTRRDQERTLHALNKLESRLRDLEEKLEDRQRDT